MFGAMAALLCGLYAVCPSFGAAVVLFTVVVWGTLTPLVVKASRSMIAMRRLQPDVERLRTVHKGDSLRFNEAVTALYRRSGVNPLTGCLPTLVQIPIIAAIFRLIRGLTAHDATGLPSPRYLGHTSRLYHDVLTAGGHMRAGTVDLAQRAVDHHASAWGTLPFFVLAASLVVVTRFQRAQRRSLFGLPAPHGVMGAVDDAWPYLLGAFALVVPAAVVLYHLVSGLVRAGQDALTARLEAT